MIRVLLLALLLLPQDDATGLIDRLGSEGLDDRAKAEEALFRLGRAAIEPLEKAARGHADPEVRARAGALLSRISLRVWGRIAVVSEQKLLLVDSRTLQVRTISSTGGGLVYGAVWIDSGRALMLRGILREDDDRCEMDSGRLRLEAVVGDDLLSAVSPAAEGYSYTPDGRSIREVYAPDGRRALRMGDPDAKVIEVATGKELASHRIEKAWKTHESAWSGDGKTVAFTASRTQEGKDSVYTNLYLADPEFKTVRQCGDGMSCMTWSPDSREILATSGQWPPDAPKKVLLLDVARGKRLELAIDAIGSEFPRFSPDGNRIAYVRVKDGTAEVVVMGRDGSGAKVVGPGRQPQWSPDGSTLAYLERTLCLTDLATGATRRGPKAESFDWSPTVR